MLEHLNKVIVTFLGRAELATACTGIDKLLIIKAFLIDGEVVCAAPQSKSDIPIDFFFDLRDFEN